MSTIKSPTIDKRLLIYLMLPLFILTVWIGTNCAHANSAPDVDITSVSRDTYSGSFDVTFDLFDAEGDSMVVSLQYSLDGGFSFVDSCSSVFGDVGSAIPSGNGYHLRWDFSLDLLETTYEGHEIILRVLADDRYPTGDMEIIVDWNTSILFARDVATADTHELLTVRPNGSGLFSLEQLQDPIADGSWTADHTTLLVSTVNPVTEKISLTYRDERNNLSTIAASNYGPEAIKNPIFMTETLALYTCSVGAQAGHLLAANLLDQSMLDLPLPPGVQGNIVWFDADLAAGRILLVTDEDGHLGRNTILLWDFHNQDLLMELQTDSILSQPKLSPLGNMVIFAMGEGTESKDLYVMNLVSGQKTQLTFASAGRSFDLPVWSPNGEVVACRCLDGNQSDIHLVFLDGQLPKNITNTSNGYEYPLDWQ